MKLTVTVNMDNDAFEEKAELIRILQQVIEGYKNENTGMQLFDSNGNKVGQWVIDGDPEYDYPEDSE